MPTQKPSQREKQQARAERAAEALRERQRKERRRQVLTVAGVLLAIVLIVAGGFVINSMRDSSKDVAKDAPTAGTGEHGVTIGPASAPHKVVVYEDFLCPICGRFEAAGHDQLKELADAGKVQVEYRPFVLLDRMGPYSELSASVFGVVLDQDGSTVAMDLHDLLFANQPSEEGPFPSEADVVALAGEAGADTDAVKKALDDGDGKAWADAATKAAFGLGVQSTPTVILDGKPFTNWTSPEDLASNLAQAVQ